MAVFARTAGRVTTPGRSGRPAASPAHRWRGVALALAAYVLGTAAAWAVLSLAWPHQPVQINVRWKPGMTNGERAALESRFRLSAPEFREGTTWGYRLDDVSTANIERLVTDDAVDDTARINRVRYRPELRQDRARLLALCALPLGGVAPMLVWYVRRRTAGTGARSGGSHTRQSAWHPGGDRGVLMPAPPVENVPPAAPAVARRRFAAVGVLAVVWLAAASWAGASSSTAVGALVTVYLGGYVVGSLLLGGRLAASDVPTAMVRTIAGLLLTTIGFLLSLVVSLPWFSGPALLLAAAIGWRGRRAFTWWPEARGWSLDGLAGSVIAVILLSPVWLSVAYMAPGAAPPVFINVDTPYTLEKVHALVGAASYPPPSLSNVGEHPSYHYGTQAMAALVSRVSGLRPHQSLFLVVLPLLCIGLASVACAAARALCPAVPRSVAVPFLLISVPTLARPFWSGFEPQTWTATSGGGLLKGLLGEPSAWGLLSNESMNIGGDFLILAAVAGLAAPARFGWVLPGVLVGSAMIVKSPVGMALMAGLFLAEGWRILRERRLCLSRQALVAGVTFLVTYTAFFARSPEKDFALHVAPLFHIGQLFERGQAAAVAVDALWLLLPAALVLSARVADPERRSATWLLMAVAPLLVVNVTRFEGLRTGTGWGSDDWLQLLHTLPFLAHTCALSVAGARWGSLARPYRVAFLAATVAAVVPVTLVAGRYTYRLAVDPTSGYEFVDNRAIVEALAAIPTAGTMIVTNDLRYPAGNFAREERQFQVPALFGHQAFAVNYAYEYAEERRPLQRLLQQPAWSAAILDAARTHHWTHLLIRKDYAHPVDIPLDPLFENASYLVFRFPTAER